MSVAIVRLATFLSNVDVKPTILYCPQSIAVRAQVKNCGATLVAMSSKNEVGCPLSLATCSNTGLNRRGYSVRFGLSRNKTYEKSHSPNNARFSQIIS